MKEKILDGPEVLSVAKDIPAVVSTQPNQYHCLYGAEFYSFCMKSTLQNP